PRALAHRPRAAYAPREHEGAPVLREARIQGGAIRGEPTTRISARRGVPLASRIAFSFCLTNERGSNGEADAVHSGSREQELLVVVHESMDAASVRGCAVRGEAHRALYG